MNKKYLQFVVFLPLLFVACSQKTGIVEIVKNDEKIALPQMKYPSTAEVFPPPLEGSKTNRPDFMKLYKGYDYKPTFSYLPEPKIFAKGDCNYTKSKPEVFISFSTPMVKKEMVGKAIKPPVIITPSEGIWIWESQDKLKFLPKGPFKGKLEYKVTVSKDIKSLNGKTIKETVTKTVNPGCECYVGSKLFTWCPTPGSPQIVSIANCSGGRWDFGNKTFFLKKSGQCIYLDQPVSTNFVKENLSVTMNGTKILYNLVEKHKELNLVKGQAYQIAFNSDFPSGSKIQFNLERALISNKQMDGGKHLFDIPIITTFAIPSRMEMKEPFFPEKTMGTIEKNGKHYTLKNAGIKFYLTFNNSVGHYNIKELKKLVTISPEATYSLSKDDKTISVEAKLDPTIKYTLHISERLKDVYGFTLKEPQKIIIIPAWRKPSIDFIKDRTLRWSENLDISTVNISEFEAEFYFLNKENIIKGILFSENGTGNIKDFVSVKKDRKNIPIDNKEKLHNFSVKELLEGKTETPVLYTISQSVPQIKNLANSKMKKYGLFQFSQMSCSIKVLPDELVIWLNDIDTGDPFVGAELSVYDEGGKLLQIKKTDGQGLAIIKEADLIDADKLFFIIEYNKKLSYYIYKKSNAFNSLKFKIPQNGIMKTSSDSGMIFTERGIYKPGEKIFFKAFLRRGSGKDMKVPEKETVTVSLLDPDNEIIAENELVTNKFGSISGFFKISPTIKTGKYTISVSEDDKILTSILVADFRKPTFNVNISHNKPYLINGENISTVVEGHYLLGYPMGGTSFTYSIYAHGKKFSPRNFEKYSFSPDRKETKVRLIETNNPKFSKDGKYIIPRSIALYNRGKSIISIQADVQNVDRQTITKVSTIELHPAAHYVGVRVATSEPEINKNTRFETVTVDPVGNLVSGKSVSLKIYRRIYVWNWESDKSDDYQNHNEEFHDVFLSDCLLTGTSGKQQCHYTFKKPGLYVIVARTKDSRGNIAEGARTFYVTGNGESALGRSTFVPMNLILDKSVYRAGDTGKVLIASPFKSAKVLLTVENQGIVHRQISNIKKGVNRLSFPIPEGIYPNGFVSVYMLTPRISNKKDSAGRDLGASQYRVGYAPFKTITKKHDMRVQITSSKAKCRPGEKVDLTVALESPDGRPVEGEVTLMVVDESVLSLTDYKTPDPQKAVFRKIGLNVRVSDSRIFDNSLNKISHPGGGGEGENESGTETQGPSGNSKHVRKFFKNTVYFNPSLKTDAKGKVSATITLPDNVTTYRIMAVAIDKKSLFGSSSKEIIVNKPLMIESALPRLLIHGDKIKAGVVAHNMTTKPVKAIVTIEAKGIKLLSNNRHSITIHPQKPVEIPFEMHAQTLGRAQFTFFIKAENGETDTVQTSIPVNPFTPTRSHSTMGMTDKSQSITLDFQKNALTGGTFSLEVTSNPMAPLKESIDFLVKYPYGCVEQTTSSTYPLLALMDILPAMGITKHSPEKLRTMSQKGIYRLSKMMTEEGGLAYWPGGKEAHPYGTAYAMLAINAAVEKGLEIPSGFRINMVEYLDKILGENGDYLIKSYIVYVLSKTKKYVDADISKIYKEKQQLGVEGKSYLYLAIRAKNKPDPRLDILLNEIVEGLDEKGEFKEKIKYNDEMFGSPLKTTSFALMALLESEKYNSLANKLMNKIVDSQKNGYFGTTQQTVFALMALAAYAKKLNISSEPPSFKVTLDNVQLNLNSPGKTVFVHNFDFPAVLAKGKQKLTITSLKKGKPVFFTLKTRFSETPPKNNMTAYSSGISVYKRIEDVKGNPALEIKGGKLVRVRLFVHIPSSIGKVRYLAVDDPLPSGLEAINTDLATSAKVTTGNDTAYNLASYTESNISFREFREDRVWFFADSINSGFWEFTYLARATTIGTGFVPPVSAHAMYDPEIYAISNPSKLTVTSAEVNTPVP